MNELSHPIFIIGSNLDSNARVDGWHCFRNLIKLVNSSPTVAMAAVRSKAVVLFLQNYTFWVLKKMLNYHYTGFQLLRPGMLCKPRCNKKVIQFKTDEVE